MNLCRETYYQGFFLQSCKHKMVFLREIVYISVKCYAYGYNSFISRKMNVITITKLTVKSLKCIIFQWEMFLIDLYPEFYGIKKQNIFD